MTSLSGGLPVVTDLSGNMPRRVPRLMASLSASTALPGTGITIDGDVSAMGDAMPTTPTAWPFPASR